MLMVLRSSPRTSFSAGGKMSAQLNQGTGLSAMRKGSPSFAATRNGQEIGKVALQEGFGRSKALCKRLIPKWSG